MKFTNTGLADAVVVEQTPFTDERGSFARAYCQQEFAKAGINETFVQANMSICARSGTLRGLHYQSELAPEAKLLRCIKGAVYDVIVDMRKDSASYRQWFGIELSADNHKAIYVPPLFAHGFLSLEDEAEVFYQTAGYYTPEAECGIRHDDPALDINWPIKVSHLSPKDQSWPDLDSQ